MAEIFDPFDIFYAHRRKAHNIVIEKSFGLSLRLKGPEEFSRKRLHNYRIFKEVAKIRFLWAMPSVWAADSCVGYTRSSRRSWRTLVLFSMFSQPRSLQQIVPHNWHNLASVQRMQVTWPHISTAAVFLREWRPMYTGETPTPFPSVRTAAMPIRGFYSHIKICSTLQITCPCCTMFR